MTIALEPRCRERVMLMACVAGADRIEQRYRVRDLSDAGICIDHPGLAIGAQLTVQIGQADRLAAECVWSREGRAGLRFLTPVDTMLARKRGTAAPVTPGGAGWLAERDDVYRRSTRRKGL